MEASLLQFESLDVIEVVITTSLVLVQYIGHEGMHPFMVYMAFSIRTPHPPLLVI
jgi:hypothetical protein